MTSGELIDILSKSPCDKEVVFSSKPKFSVETDLIGRRTKVKLEEVQLCQHIDMTL